MKSIHSIHTVAELQIHLDRLLQWCVKWQLSFNILKCKLIHYGKYHGFGGYCINGHPQTSVDYHKSLGVTFDCNWDFHQHTFE